MQIKKSNNIEHTGQVVYISKLTKTSKGEPHLKLRLQVQHKYQNDYYIVTWQLRNKLARTNAQELAKGMNILITGWMETVKNKDTGRDDITLKADNVEILSKTQKE